MVPHPSKESATQEDKQKSTTLTPIMSQAFWNTFHPIVSCVPKVAPKLSWGHPECFQTTPISSLSPKLSNDGSYMGVPHQDPTLPIGF